MKTQLALAVLLAVCTVSVQAQQSTGSSSSGGSSSGASPSSTVNAGKSQSGPAKDEPPAQKPQKVAYARCCVPPGGDGTSEKPYSSFAEADADKSWNKLSVMPTQGDLDKMGSDTLQSQTDEKGSVNVNKAPTFTPPPRSTQTTLSGRVIETIGTSNIFDCKCAPPSAPGK
ncbi:MAG: hypothetical protein K2X50_02635 [Gammaproteobacteria bacterium]|nr:hypothetical protein [Gammaproteobacteria bacterium]